MTRVRCLAAAIVLFGAVGGSLTVAVAQTYPDKTIKFIVPYTPGSPVDAGARVIAEDLQKRLGQSVVLEARSGAGSAIGTKVAAAAPPDGYTLLLTGTPLAYLPTMYPNSGGEVVKDLVPIAPFLIWSHVIVVVPEVPAKTLPELVAYAKANPGKLVWGYGLGSAPHILGASLIQAAGIDLASIPYRGGDGARADLLGGRVHMNIAPLAAMLPLIRDGKVRPLAFTGPARSADLPDVPTTKEAGFPTVGYDPDVWLGILGPAGTPPAVVNKINAAVNEALKTPEVQAAFKRLGFEPLSQTPQPFARFLDGELKKWPPLLAAAGIKAQ
jgi:tripartite-type tricarboxylate transporter receptor subunit TctC